MNDIRDLTLKEDKPLQVLANEDLNGLIKKEKKSTPRASVMATYQKSYEVCEPLYRKLAE